MEKNIYKPGIEGDILYLNVGLDYQRSTPMDIVPFPLQPVKTRDSISFSKVIPNEKYESIVMMFNYLTDSDYKHLVKVKKIAFNVGELDYNKLMRSSYTSIDIK